MPMIRSAMPFTSTSLRIQAKTCSEQSRDAPMPLPIPSYMGSNPSPLFPPKTWGVQPKAKQTPQSIDLLPQLGSCFFLPASKGDKKWCYLFIPQLLDTTRESLHLSLLKATAELEASRQHCPNPHQITPGVCRGLPHRRQPQLHGRAVRRHVCQVLDLAKAAQPQPGPDTASLCPAGPAAARDPAPCRSSAG